MEKIRELFYFFKSRVIGLQKQFGNFLWPFAILYLTLLYLIITFPFKMELLIEFAYYSKTKTEVLPSPKGVQLFYRDFQNRNIDLQSKAKVISYENEIALLKFSLPLVKGLFQVRIDPLSLSPLSYSQEIRSVTLKWPFHQVVWKGSDLLQIFYPAHELSSFSINDKTNGLQLATLGDDPYLISKEGILQGDLESNKSWKHFKIASLFGKISILILLHLFLFFTFSNRFKYRKSIEASRFLNSTFSFERKNYPFEWRPIPILALLAPFYFYLFQLFFYAYRIGDSIAPDETEHYRYAITFMRQTNWIPYFQSGSDLPIYEFRNTGFILYHFVVGKIASLFQLGLLHFFGSEAGTSIGAKIIKSPSYHLVLLRFASIPFAIGTFIYAAKMLLYVTKNIYMTSIGLILLSNILMFTFISGMISYDVWTVCFGTVSTFYLLKLIGSENSDRVTPFYKWLIFSLLGVLGKITYAPLLIIHLFPLFKVLPKNSLLRGLKNRVYFGLVLLLLLFNSFHFGKNVILYKSIFPSCEVVNSLDQCQKFHGEFQRDIDLKKEGEHIQVMGFRSYLGHYLDSSLNSIFGIFGTKSIPQNSNNLSTVKSILSLFLFLLLLQLPTILRNKLTSALLFITFSYTAVVIFRHYNSYLSHHIFVLALQGRYHFPVIVPMLSLFVITLFSSIKERWWPFLLLAALIFLPKQSFLYFLKEVSSSWFIN